MARKFLTGIDLVQNQLLNGALQNLAAPPSTPVGGQVYWDTTQAAAGNPALLAWNATASAWELKATNALLLQGQNGAYYLARANQTGTQLAATISNLQATVVTYTLDQFAPPAGAVSMAGQRLTNLPTPTAGSDAATKTYVDANIQGLSPKPTAAVATAAPLPTNVYANGSAGVGATLTATANGVLTIDGYAVALNDIVLVKNEAATQNNGLYNVTTLGSASIPYVLTRNADMDQTGEFIGAFIAVNNKGATTANTLWLCGVPSAVTVGTSAVPFVQLNAATALLGSTTILIAGNSASVIVAPGGGLVIGASGLSLDTTVGVRKYASLVGDGAALSYTITHNLNTQDVVTALYSAATPFDVRDCDVNNATLNTVTLGFAVAPTANQYRVVVQG